MELRPIADSAAWLGLAPSDVAVRRQIVRYTSPLE